MLNITLLSLKAISHCVQAFELVFFETQNDDDIMKYNYCVTQFLGDKTAENSFKSISFHFVLL
jgi:hypothetical protein